MGDSWLAMVDVAERVTGRRVNPTDGGLYSFGVDELAVPYGSVEGLTHEVCHWVVASESERRMENMGLSQDWEHPRYDRMVKCEELAWSLENYLLGDPPPEVLGCMMTPEARSSGGGGYYTEYERERVKNLQGAAAADAVALIVTRAAEAEMFRAKERVFGHGEIRPDGSEALRREALAAAEKTGLPVKEIQKIVRTWWLAQYPEPIDDKDELRAYWRDLKR
jgi:hypothetical protein